MKLHQIIPLLLRGAIGVFVLQGLMASPIMARDNDRGRGTPRVVTSLDSTTDRLVRSYQDDLSERRGRPSGESQRFLQSLRSLEARADTLRSDVENRASTRRLQEDISSVRSSLNYAYNSSREVRLSERTRGLLGQTRSLVSEVEAQRGAIYAVSGDRDRRDDHDHDHRDDRRDSRDSDRRPSGPGGILGKLFGQ